MAKDCSNQECTRESCEGCPSKSGEAFDFSAPMNKSSKVRHVIGIVSGKGGVGKSSVTALLAVYLKKQGYKVGILDADITGPSIPKMFGVKEVPGVQGEEILPAVSKGGIKIMSINLLLEQEDTPVIWRGPVLAGVVKQFWSDVIWGELDYLLVDMPPGTGDVALTVFQSLPIEGVFLITSPQRLVEMVVKKAYNMAEQMNIPVLGIIENFRYVQCPDCGKQILAFGESRVEEWADSLAVPFIAALSLDPMMPDYADRGAIENYRTPDLSGIRAVLPE